MFTVGRLFLCKPTKLLYYFNIRLCYNIDIGIEGKKVDNFNRQLERENRHQPIIKHYAKKRRNNKKDIK